MRAIIRPPVRLLALLAIVLAIAGEARGASVRFTPVGREVIEQRLDKFSDDNRQREQTLKQLFAEAGCDATHLSEQAVKGSRLPNVVCVLPGSSGKTILVGAHFDHVTDGDGVVDNWSGASLLPSLFQALKTEPREHTYVFIGFTDEERGEIGSHEYARSMTKEQAAATDAMVNMDTLGLGPTKVWVSHSDKHLVSALNYVAQNMGLPLEGMNVEQVGTTDSEQFVSRKIPRITIHSLTQQTWDAGILHTSKDRLSQIRLDDYVQTYRLIAAYLAYLDQAARPPAPVGSR